MPQIPAGITSRPRKRIGNLLFQSWKGIPVVRSWTAQSNPNTPGQQAQRAKFASAQIVYLSARTLPLPRVWFYYGYKKFLQGDWLRHNLTHFTPSIDWLKVSISKGSLSTPSRMDLIPPTYPDICEFNYRESGEYLYAHPHNATGYGYDVYLNKWFECWPLYRDYYNYNILYFNYPYVSGRTYIFFGIRCSMLTPTIPGDASFSKVAVWTKP